MKKLKHWWALYRATATFSWVWVATIIISTLLLALAVFLNPTLDQVLLLGYHTILMLVLMGWDISRDRLRVAWRPAAFGYKVAAALAEHKMIDAALTSDDRTVIQPHESVRDPDGLDTCITEDEIILRRILDHDGQACTTYRIPDEMPLWEVLGLIELAKVHISDELLREES